MAALREAGLTARIGVAPGPANGFTLDLIACLERFGERIDWAMIILNPLEPWPGELCLDAAARHERQGAHPGRRLRRPLLGRPAARAWSWPKRDHRAFRPDGWIEAGLEKLERLLPIAERAELTPIQLACQWNLAHPAVECVAPTLIQEIGPEACPIEAKRAELATLPAEQRLSAEDVAAIRAIGDNTGCMALKGASPEHEGEERPDRWALDERARRRRRPLGHRPRARPRRDALSSGRRAGRGSRRRPRRRDGADHGGRWPAPAPGSSC